MEAGRDSAEDNVRQLADRVEVRFFSSSFVAKSDEHLVHMFQVLEQKLVHSEETRTEALSALKEATAEIEVSRITRNTH